MVAETSCHHSRTSTFNRVLSPSHPLPDTLALSTDIHQNLSLGHCRPPLVGRVRSAGVFSLLFFKSRDGGSAVFLGVQINLRLGNMSSTGLFDESVGQ